MYSLYTMVYTPHAKIMNKNGDCGLLITCVVAQYLLVLCAQEARIFAAVVRLLHSYRWQSFARAHRNYSAATRGSCCNGCAHLPTLFIFLLLYGKKAILHGFQETL